MPNQRVESSPLFPSARDFSGDLRSASRLDNQISVAQCETPTALYIAFFLSFSRIPIFQLGFSALKAFASPRFLLQFSSFSSYSSEFFIMGGVQVQHRWFFKVCRDSRVSTPGDNELAG